MSIQKDGSTIIEFNKICCEILDTRYDTALKDLDEFCEKLKNKVDEFKGNRKDEITKLLHTSKDQAETNVVIVENL